MKLLAQDIKKLSDKVSRANRKRARAKMADIIFARAKDGYYTASVKADILPDWLRDELIQNGFNITCDTIGWRYYISWET